MVATRAGAFPSRYTSLTCWHRIERTTDSLQRCFLLTADKHDVKMFMSPKDPSESLPDVLNESLVCTFNSFNAERYARFVAGRKLC